jgi:hypothetical protein
MTDNEQMTFNRLITGLMDTNADHGALREAWRRAAIDQNEEELNTARSMASTRFCRLISAKNWGHRLDTEYRVIHQITGKQFSIWGRQRPMTQGELESHFTRQFETNLSAA